jgi:hypothetical protein
MSAREESDEATEELKTMSQKLAMDVIQTARVVAALRRETILELISGILRPVLQKMEREELAKRSASVAAADAAGRKAKGLAAPAAARPPR